MAAARAPAAVLAAPSPHAALNCQYSSLCAEVANSSDVFGSEYVGHDEPSNIFYSNKPGSGNHMQYTLRLPRDPSPGNANSPHKSYQFELNGAFWFGMAMCDTQSYPNTVHFCKPNSDSNIVNPAVSPNHPGTAFMEMQFYPPGWVPWPTWQVAVGASGCDPTKWCAALNIDSLSENPVNGTLQNSTCAAKTGIEYVNFAFITHNGVAQAPANPVDSTAATTFTPSNKLDLFMHSGDTLTVAMGDTADGFRVVINDRSTGQSGSMTASAANGFGEVKFAPTGTSCTNIPTNFHPMYSTSSPDTRVPWAAHSYNVAFSDEIGHFEYCNAVNESTGKCTAAGVTDPSGVDADDVGCFGPKDSERIRISGCTATDVDFDGPEYANTWPGTFSDAKLDAQFHATPIQFTSPLFNGSSNYDRAAFEADLPRIENATSPPCQRFISNPASPSPGAGCVNPPVGATFYPFYSTTSVGGQCQWQLGGPFIPETTNNFGGSSAAEFGPLLALFYPAANGMPSFRYNDFRNVLRSNPCPA